jgi:hypothetical protein
VISRRLAAEIQVVRFDREQADRTETGEDFPRRVVEVGVETTRSGSEILLNWSREIPAPR